MDKNNIILIASGCSFTGGGNFNNKTFFLKEFPEYKEVIDSGVFDEYNQLNDNDSEFKKLYRDYLWPHQLGKLLGTKKTYNLGSPGKGITSTLGNLYNSIFHLLDEGEKAENLLITYQIPTFLRKEIYVENTDTFSCVLTELSDDDETKINFISNHYNEMLLFRNYINELYKFKTFCKLLNIEVYLWSWDMAKITDEEIYDKLKIKLENKKESNHYSDNQYLINYKSFDKIEHLDIDKMINEIEMINFDGYSMENYAKELNIKKFNFTMKYPGEIKDSHPTKEGCKFVAETLYKAIISKQKKII